MIVFLSLTALIGTTDVSADIGRWQVLGQELFPFWPICKAVVLCAGPTFAIIDLCFRRPSGRYLALVPVIWLWGGCLRFFIQITFTKDFFRARLLSEWLLTCFVMYFLSSFILKLGFSKPIRSYLDS